MRLRVQLSWRILSIRGIDVKIHSTFLFALLWGAVVWGNDGPFGRVYGVFLTIVLFGIVLLHELGHALAAQRYGVEVHDIVLLPIGGVARLSRMPEKPSQELAVSLAGPAVNLAFVVLLGPILILLLGDSPVRGLRFGLPSLSEPGWINFLSFLVGVNLSLLLFNMLPAFPMDGGRALRALLAMRMPFRRATALAVAIGRAFALLFGAAGLFTGNVMLALVGMFVFFGGGSEYEEVSRRESLRGVTVSEVVDTRAPHLPASLPAFTAFDRLTRTPYSAMAVVDDAGGLIGVVTRQGMQAKWTAGVRGEVSAFAEPSKLVVDCGAALDVVGDRMAQAHAAVAAVFCGSRFQGLLDLDTISRVVAAGRGRRSTLEEPAQKGII